MTTTEDTQKIPPIDPEELMDKLPDYLNGYEDVTDAEINHAFEDAVYSLFNSEPFLYHILANFRLVFNDLQVKIAATTITRRGPILYLSKPFVKFEKHDQISIIKHEALHILYGHIPRTKYYTETYKGKYTKRSIAQLLNVAQDLAINPSCLIGKTDKTSHFYDFGCFPEKKNFEFPPDLASDEYFDLLMQNAKVIPASIGDHCWEDAEEDMSPEELGAMNEALINKAKDDTIKAHGSLGSEYEELLEKLYGRKGIDWRNELRMTFQQEAFSGKRASYKRKNRRKIQYAKGFMKNPKNKIGVITDVSGSMSNKDVQFAFHEVDNLAGKADVYHIQADVGVRNVERWKKGQIWERKGCGGTDMTEAFDYFVERKFNTIICITDGGMYFPPHLKDAHIIWVSTTDAQYPYGKVIRITDTGSWWERTAA